MHLGAYSQQRDARPYIHLNPKRAFEMKYKPSEETHLSIHVSSLFQKFFQRNSIANAGEKVDWADAN